MTVKEILKDMSILVSTHTHYAKLERMCVG